VLSKAKTSPFAHRIHFTGFIDERDKPYLYNLAKIFVYPSYYEGFGFPVVEAMSCGIPTITSNISSLPEITKGQAITISPYNVHELIWSLEQLLSDQRLYQEYVLRSGSIRATYQWRRSAIQTYKIFEELI
jgi:glycosyltransferase involved in cell wall biosynthesis